MNISSILAGSTLAVKFSGVSFDRYRLDVIVYADTSEPVIKASSHPDESFPTEIMAAGETAMLFSVPGSVTADMAGSVLSMEERYTDMDNGYRQVYRTRIEVKDAIIGQLSNGIPEGTGHQDIEINRDLAVGDLTSYELAVANGFHGTEDEWLDMFKKGQDFIFTPALELRTKRSGTQLEYRITNTTSRYLEQYLDEYYIGLLRYRKCTERSMGKYHLVDDEFSRYHRVQPGQPIVTPKLNDIYWTDIQIRPVKLASANTCAWQILPYTPQQLSERFIRFVSADNKLSDVFAALDATPAAAAKMLRVSGKNNRKVFVGTDKTGRTKINYSLLCGLDIFRTIEFVNQKGQRELKRVAGPPVYFRVGLLAHFKKDSEGNYQKVVRYSFRVCQVNARWV